MLRFDITPRLSPPSISPDTSAIDAIIHYASITASFIIPLFHRFHFIDYIFILTLIDIVDITTLDID